MVALHEVRRYKQVKKTPSAHWKAATPGGKMRVTCNSTEISKCTSVSETQKGTKELGRVKKLSSRKPQSPDFLKFLDILIPKILWYSKVTRGAIHLNNNSLMLHSAGCRGAQQVNGTATVCLRGTHSMSGERR